MRGINLFALVPSAEIYVLLPICHGNIGDKPKVQTYQQATTPLGMASANNSSCHCYVPVICVKEICFSTVQQ